MIKNKIWSYIVSFIFVLLIVVLVVVTLNLSDEVSFKNRPMKMNIDSNISLLKKHIQKLTAVVPARNYQNVEALNYVADYIENNFRSYCSDVNLQRFHVGETEYKNVLCSFNIEKKQRIVIGAHYDVAGNQPGADDNASGVAGLLELARMLQEFASSSPYRIDLVAYSLEEPPFFRSQSMGSYQHAKSLNKDNSIVKIMICLEMIGYFSIEEGSQSYPLPLLSSFYSDVGNYIMVVGNLGGVKETKKVRALMRASSRELDVFSINLPFWIPGVDFSDHYNYWKFGFPAVMITDTAFYRNENYHLPSDTIETLNFYKMSAVVNAVFYSVMNFHND